MKKQLFFYFTIIHFIIFITHNVYAQSETDLVPITKSNAIQILEGKNKTYYQLSEEYPITVNVKSIDKLIIYSRMRMSENNTINSYTIKCLFDNSDVTDFKYSRLTPSKLAVFSDKSINKTPSTYKKSTIEPPKNTKTINFYTTNNNHDVVIRIVKLVNDEPIDITPINYSDIKNTTLLSGKVHSYYNLSKKISLRLEGPGKIIIHSRLVLDNYDIIPKSCTYFYIVDGKKQQYVKVTNVVKSVNAAFLELKAHKTLTLLQKDTLPVPPEVHNFVFPPNKNSATLLRFTYQSDAEKPVWSDIKPVSKNEVVVLEAIKNNKIRKYYRISRNDELQFSVTGPKKLRIISRGEFKYQMHSNNNYRIQIMQNDKLLNTYKYSCHRSKEIQYVNNKSLIPGTLDKIYLDVGEGEHSFKISIPDSKKTVLLRISQTE